MSRGIRSKSTDNDKNEKKKVDVKPYLSKATAVPWEPDTTIHSDLVVRVFLLLMGWRFGTLPFTKKYHHLWSLLDNVKAMKEEVEFGR